MTTEHTPDYDDYEVWDEAWEDEEESSHCKYCGESVIRSWEWEHAGECPNQDSIWMKGICSEATKISEVVDAFAGHLAILREHEAEGWTLKKPEVNGHIFLVKHLS